MLVNGRDDIIGNLEDTRNKIDCTFKIEDNLKFEFSIDKEKSIFRFHFTPKEAEIKGKVAQLKHDTASLGDRLTEEQKKKRV